ncbi:MAG: tetratricopeptide repeat protein [Planctomycetota bacterium]|jgi:serine/threonine protein kinase/tetratricopeptide (TPR) repeat protein
MSRDGRIPEVLGEWRERLERGEHVDPEEVIAAHPELAEELRRRFETMAMADRFFGTAQPQRTKPPELGGYRIIRELGRGGMGIVYEAEQVSMRRRVALKVLYPTVTSSPQAVQRFRQEAWAAGRLKHTNIAAIHELGRDGATWFAAMELVQGRTLGDVLEDMRRTGGSPRESRLARRALDQSTGAIRSWTGAETGTRAYYVRIAEMFAEVAEALQVAHDHGVLHRDIKPGNLILDADGHLKVVDFGLARLDEDENAMTRTGDLVGTPLYMSPEQLGLGNESLDHRTDVYSLGATLFEALTLRPPHAGRNLQQVVARVARSEAPSPRHWDRSLPRDLETIVRKAIANRKETRYAHARDLAFDLRMFAAGETIRARRVGPATRLFRYARAHKVRSALAAGLLGALIAIGIQWVEARDRGRTMERQRVALRDQEYDRLCLVAMKRTVLQRDPWREAGADSVPGSPVGARTDDPFGVAERYEPNRPEAYLGRLLYSHEMRGDPGVWLEKARARGLPERGYWYLRAVLLASRGATDSVSDALARATAARRAGPIDDLLEAEYLYFHSRDDRNPPRRIWDRLIDSDAVPEFIRAYARVRRIHDRQRHHDWAGAIEDLAAMRDGELNVEIECRIGLFWERVGSLDRALAILERLTEQTRSANAAHDWTRLLVACRFQPAVFDRLCAEALEAFPDEPDLQVCIARRSVLANQLREALKLCDAALARAPDSSFARFGRLAVLARLGQDAEATREHDALLEKGIAPRKVRRALVDGYFFGQHFEALEPICRRLAEDGDPFWQFALAGVLFETGRAEAARERLDDAVRRGVLRPSEWARRAPVGDVISLYHRMGETARALELVDASLQRQPDDPGIRVLKVFLLEQAGMRAEAEAGMASIPATARGDHSFWCLRGRILAVWGRWDEVEAAERRALRLDPTCTASQLALGQALAMQGRREQALVHLRLACAQPRNADEARNWIGQTEYEGGAYDKAIETLTALLRDSPQYVQAHRHLAYSLYQLGRLPEALPHARAAMAGPDVIPASDLMFDVLAEGLRLDENWRELADVLSQAREGGHPRARIEVVLLARAAEPELRDPPRALALARELLSRNPGDDGARFTLGIAQLSAGLHREAARTFAWTGARRRTVENLLYEALALARLGRPELASAASAYVESTSRRPQIRAALRTASMRRLVVEVREAAAGSPSRAASDIAPILASLSSDRVADGDALFAVSLALEAVGHMPNRQALWLVLADALKRMQSTAWLRAVGPDGAARLGGVAAHLTNAGRFDDALAFVSVAIEAKPNDPHLHFVRALVLRASGKPQAALDHLEEAGREHPSILHDPGVRREIGQALFDLGQFEQAATTLGRFVEADPGQPWIWALLAKCHNRLGDHDAAAATFRTARRIHPKHVGLIRDLAVLLNNLGKGKEAVEVAGAGIVIAPDDWHLHYVHAYACGEADRHADALRFAQAGLKRFPAEPAPFLQVMGSALASLGRQADAQDLWYRHLSQAERPWSAHTLLVANALAWSYADCPDLKLRNPARAEAIGRLAAAGPPKHPAHQLTYGAALHRNGKPAKAIKVIEAAIEKLVGKKEALARYYAALATHASDPTTARRHYDWCKAWMTNTGCVDEDLLRLREEAQQVLGVERE